MTWSTLGQWVRHHVSALAATGVDYGVMIGGVELAGVRPVPATALGAFVGAVTNFALGRWFTYRAGDAPVAGQAWRYGVVSATSLAWNASGEALLHDVLGLQYVLARVITSIVVGNAWNYPLQRRFVFKRREAA
jgi:putative flippase GtrA